MNPINFNWWDFFHAKKQKLSHFCESFIPHKFTQLITQTCEKKNYFIPYKYRAVPNIHNAKTRL